MNINFNDVTFEKLHFLANLEGRSVAAFVSLRMDELVGQLVNTTFSVNELPEGVVPAHLDPTPRPAPRSLCEGPEDGLQFNLSTVVLNSDKYSSQPGFTRHMSRRHAEELS